MTDHYPTLAHEWATVNGLRMHSRVSRSVAGDGKQPVVLVHGLVVSSRYMMPTARRLAAYYHVYVPDLPGFGRSEHPGQVLDTVALADTLVDWMDTKGIAAAALISNSLGCQIVANVAKRHPHHVTQAILVGPTMDRTARTPLEEWARLMIDLPRERLSLMPIQMRDFLQAGPVALLRTLHYALYDRLERKVPHMHMPTLIVRGSRDPIVSQWWVERLHHLLPHSELVVLRGAPHAINYSAPDALVAVVHPFLERHLRPVPVPELTKATGTPAPPLPG